MHLFLPRRKPVMDTGLLIPSENYLKKLSVKTALLSSRYVSGPSEFDSEELLRGYECKKDFETLPISFPFLLYSGKFRMSRWRRQQERQTNKQTEQQFQISKTTTLHVRHTFWYISLSSVHDYDVIFLVLWRTWAKDDEFLFLLMNLDIQFLIFN